MKFRAKRSKLIFKNSFPKLLSRFSFWTKINVQNQKPNFRFNFKNAVLYIILKLLKEFPKNLSCPSFSHFLTDPLLTAPLLIAPLLFTFLFP